MIKELFEKLRLVLQPIEIDMEVEDFIGHRSSDRAYAPFIFSFRSPDDSGGIIFKRRAEYVFPKREQRTTWVGGNRVWKISYFFSSSFSFSSALDLSPSKNARSAFLSLGIVSKTFL